MSGKAGDGGRAAVGAGWFADVRPCTAYAPFVPTPRPEMDQAANALVAVPARVDVGASPRLAMIINRPVTVWPAALPETSSVDRRRSLRPAAIHRGRVVDRDLVETEGRHRVEDDSSFSLGAGR